MSMDNVELCGLLDKIESELSKAQECMVALVEERDALAATCEQYYEYCKALGITPVPAIGKPSYNLSARDEKSRREGAVAAMNHLAKEYWQIAAGAKFTASDFEQKAMMIELGELRPWEVDRA